MTNQLTAYRDGLVAKLNSLIDNPQEWEIAAKNLQFFDDMQRRRPPKKTKATPTPRKDLRRGRYKPVKREGLKLVYHRLGQEFPNSGFLERGAWARQYLESGLSLGDWIVKHRDQIRAERKYIAALRFALGSAKIVTSGRVYAREGKGWRYRFMMHSPECDEVVQSVLGRMS